MRRANLKLALTVAVVAALCASAAGVYATGRAAAGDAAASATATPTARSFVSRTCVLSAAECDDMVQEPELTCEEAHACVTPTLPDVVCDDEEACPPGRRICPGVTPEPRTPGTFDNSIAICGTPCGACPVRPPCAVPDCRMACPALVRAPAPAISPDIACPLPTCPDVTPVAGTDVASAIAPLCSPLPCASSDAECKAPQLCAMSDGASTCPSPPRCVPVAPAPPGEVEPQTSDPLCPEPLPPDCVISSDGAGSCPTPGEGYGGAGSVPPSDARGATPSVGE